MYYKAAPRLPFFHIFSYFIFHVNDNKTSALREMQIYFLAICP